MAIDFSLSDEQKALQAGARQFAATVLSQVKPTITPIARPEDRFFATQPFYAQMAAAGFIHALFPKAYGGGGMSTVDTLWMGVPVVSLAGSSLVGRVGASLLSRAGLANFVAESPAAYIRIAAELARDPERLTRLRAGMRRRLTQSSLTNGRVFARDVERAYRRLWHAWCQG